MRSSGSSPAAKWNRENPRQALSSANCGKNSASSAEVGRELLRYEFAYPGKNPILLIFLKCRPGRGEIENRIFETVLWERARRLRSYDFLEGDAPFLTAFTGPAIENGTSRA